MSLIISSLREAQLHLKPKVFFTSSLKLRSALLEKTLISFRLWRRSAIASLVKLPPPAGGCVTFTARLRRLNFPYTLPNAIFNVCFLSFSIWGRGRSPKVWFWIWISKFTHLLCKSSNFQQSYKFPDKSSQIVMIDKLLMQQLRQKSASISCKCLQLTLYYLWAVELSMEKC